MIKLGGNNDVTKGQMHACNKGLGVADQQALMLQDMGRVGLVLCYAGKETAPWTVSLAVMAATSVWHHTFHYFLEHTTLMRSKISYLT